MSRHRKIPKQHKPTASTYWHGGAPGLGVGDEVIPASELDKLPEVYRVPDYATCDPSQVYVTSILDAARTFAALYIDWSGPLPAHRPGAVYRVQPLGPVVEDPDYAGSQAFFSCERATVLEVMETGLTMVSEATQLAVLQFHTWDDGKPMYDVAGYGLPPTAAISLGVTPSDLRPLGFGPDPMLINHRCAEILGARGVDLTPYLQR